MLMNAAVLHEQGLPHPFADSEPFQIEQVQLDPPGPGEVLVEIRAAGLCHSDLSVLEGMRARPLPVVGGHEGAGIVRATGQGVTGFSEGDHVVVTVAGCGGCRICLAGRPSICQAVAGARAEGVLATGGRRLRLHDGTPLNHYSGLSVFAEYAVLASQSLVKISSEVPFEVAALFGCAVVTGAGAVYNSARVTPGSKVAVIGLGGVGLAAVMSAREAGASEIIAIDVLPSKFALAGAVGATHCVDGRDPLAVEHIRDLTQGGADYVFEMSGSMEALGLAQKIAFRGGEVIGVGIGRSDRQFSVEHLSWICEEHVLRGSFMGGGVPQRDIPKYVALYLAGRLPVDQLQSEQISFQGLNAAFDKLHNGLTIRQVLVPHCV